MTNPAKIGFQLCSLGRLVTMEIIGPVTVARREIQQRRTLQTTQVRILAIEKITNFSKCKVAILDKKKYRVGDVITDPIRGIPFYEMK